jgi:hypothetical protein
MLRFIQSFFRKTPRPPAECTRIQGAELRMGMVVSLHDRPCFDHATGRIYLLTYHGTQYPNLLGLAKTIAITEFLENSGIQITAYLETLDGRDFGTIRVYWDEYLWIYDD